ncbi:MAG: NEW3 domain-containing protein [Candidatus Bathyarchaeia archaeon]
MEGDGTIIYTWVRNRLRHKRAGVLSLLVALILVSVLGNAEAQTTTVESGVFSVVVVSVYWGSNQSSPVEAGPGDRNQLLNVELQNNGTRDITVIEAVLHLNGTPFTNTLGEALAYASGPVVIRVGSRGTVRFNLNIADGASLGLHGAPMSVYYWAITGEKTSLAVDARIPLFGKPLLRVASSLLFASPGNVTLGLSLQNQGSGRADRVQASLTLPPPLTLLEGRSQWSLGSLDAGRSVALNPVVYVPESAAGSTYRFTVAVSYVDSYGSAKTAEGSFDLAILRVLTASTELSVKVDPATGPAGVVRRISGRLVRLDTGAGIAGARITLEVVDPTIRSEIRNFTTGVQGYWEDTYMPSLDGAHLVTARFDGGPSPEGASVIFGPSRAEATLTVALPVSISSTDPWQVAKPGGTVNYSVRVQNQGLRPDRFLLGLRGLPSDFEGHFYSGSVEVKAVEIQAGSGKDLKVTVVLPEKAGAGTYRFQVEAKGEYAGAVYDLAATVEEVSGGIELSSPLSSLTVATGEVLSYPVRVRNLGAEPTQVFLSMNKTTELLDWRGSFSEDGRTVDRLLLGAGESRWLVFRAQPPYLVRLGHYRLIVYAATADGLYDYSLEFRAEILGSYRLEMGLEPLNPTVYTGEKGDLTVKVMNRGLSPVTGLSLDVDGPSWLTVTIIPMNVLSLAPNEEYPFLVRLSAPATATPGDYNVTITAICQEGRFASTPVPVSVQTSIPWYWITVAVAAVGAGLATLGVERLLRRLRIRAAREPSV